MAILFIIDHDRSAIRANVHAAKHATLATVIGARITCSKARTCALFALPQQKYLILDTILEHFNLLAPVFATFSLVLL